ncbi:MAG: DUF2058 domain-containing protein [Gammaproteobacteria bacterium]|nr:DUF2058 domain-containing protein [Gammaproteobacteria bacterium]
MANAFQDQLRKAGLVDEKKVKKAKKEKYQQSKKQGKNAVVEDEAKRLAKQAMEEKAARDRELNRQKKEEADKKAVVAQIRQLITMNARPKDDGDLAYNFSDAGVVKKLYVSEQTQRMIVNGRLTIVKLDETYELVPTAVADKIAQRDDSYLILRNEQQEQSVDEDDPYADYQIPDDLMW